MPQSHGKRQTAVLGQQQEGVKILVPGQQQRVSADGHQRGNHQRQVNEAKQLQGCCAIHPGGFVELIRQLVGCLLEHPDAIRRGNRDHRQNQRPLVVEQAVIAHGFVHGHRQERRRNEIGEQGQVHDGAAAAHLQPADRKRGRGGDSQRQEANRQSDHQRVAHLYPEVVEVEVLLPEHKDEVVERRVLRP